MGTDLVWDDSEMCLKCEHCGQLIALEDYKFYEGWTHCPGCGACFNNIEDVMKQYC